MATIIAEEVIALVSNIPDSFHSQDLRNYFSQFVEEGRFRCFHFRNRPVHKLHKTDKNEPHSPASQFSNTHSSTNTSDTDTDCKNSSNTTEERSSAQGIGTIATAMPTCTTTLTTEKLPRPMPPHVAKGDRRSGADIDEIQTGESGQFHNAHRTEQSNRKCCIIKTSQENLTKSLGLYHRKPWVDRSGDAMGIRCLIVGIKFPKHGLTRDDLLELPELSPPEIMPQGNVGTPTQSFLQLIRDCKIPPSVIRKLGLTFPKRRSNRIYGNVPLHYGGTAAPGSSDESEEEVARTATGEEIVDVVEGDPGLVKPVTGETVPPPQRRRHNSSEEEQKSDSEEDDDTCEEWERHEAFHEDVTKQDRTGERLFEEEMEIVWDKGSSGLVFYTDAAYWDAMKGDFDERTSDEWDVDMSIFYEKDGGTKDARDWLQIQKEQRRGMVDTSVFTKDRIGQFERHTKGFGGQLMDQLGWKEGEGLGRTKRGMKAALENEGQTSRDKRGFGFHGEKLCRYPVKKKCTEGAIISTVYDNPEEVDPPATLLRSVEPTQLKHRKEIS